MYLLTKCLEEPNYLNVPYMNTTNVDFSTHNPKGTSSLYESKSLDANFNNLASTQNEPFDWNQ